MEESRISRRHGRVSITTKAVKLVVIKVVNTGVDEKLALRLWLVCKTVGLAGIMSSRCDRRLLRFLVPYQGRVKHSVFISSDCLDV